MEDGQQQSDDEPKKKSEESSSPKRVGKKLKIDDERWGSIMQVIGGQDSSSMEKDDNVDSGVCADKSESISSDEPMSIQGNKDKTSFPSTPSTSNVSWTEEVKLSLKPKKGRNYRKRSSSLCMSTDSDDDSSHGDKNVVENENNERAEIRLGEDVGTAASSLPVENNDSRPIVDDVGIETHSVRSEGMSSELTYGINDSDNHNDEDDDPDNGMVENDQDDDDSSLDTDTDVDEWTDVEQSTLNNEDNAEYETPNVLLKRKPDHNWFIIKELMRREIGLGIGSGRVAKNDVLFEQRYYGSLHVVYRLELMYKLNRHKSCVNAINFHPEGDLLASGSDDMNVIIWDWASNSCVQVLKSGHKSNVFQSRFLYLNARSQLNVVSCARDGQVRLIQCPPSGGGPSSIVRRKLTQHTRAAHKLHVWPSEPHLVISAGEDGNVIMSDVRVDDPTKLFRVRDRGTAIPLYSVHGHPIEPRELLIGGQDSFVRVYDRRKVGPNAKPINMYCPSYFLEHQDHNTKKLYSRRRAFYVSCAVYNHNGSEILASYNEDDIYLFDSVTDRYVKDSTNTNSGFSHRYSGHRNSATFKGVAFFGPHSEFVVSGSDCSNIYIWDRKTEAIVQWMLGDEGGVVNCIESHPRCPVLATSGLDKDIKIWVPSNEKDPLLTGLREVIRANKRVEMRSPLFTDFLPTLYSVWGRDAREELGRRDSEEDGTPRYAGNIEFDGSTSA